MADTVVQHGEQELDGGAPFVHEEEGAPTKSAEKPTEKSDVEKRLDTLEKEIASRDKRIEELSQSERYWADQAKGRKPETDDEPEADPAADDPEPDKLLDELSTKGLQAIRDRGFMTKSEVEKMVNARLNQTLEQVTEGQAFDQRLQKDFPDITDQKSDLFKRAGEHFREMVALDPNAKSSRVALYAAAKLASKELAMEKVETNRNDREERRRDRIESQAGERGRGRGEEEGGRDLDLSPVARTVIGNLARFGVTEESFRKHQGGTTGGKRGR